MKFESNFYSDQTKWKYKIIPYEVSKNETDRVVDLQIYKTHYVVIQKLNVFLGKQVCRYFCKRCLNSYTNQDVLIFQTQKCDQQKITSIKLTNEPHMYWKKTFSYETIII